MPSPATASSSRSSPPTSSTRPRPAASESSTRTSPRSRRPSTPWCGKPGGVRRVSREARRRRQRRRDRIRRSLRDATRRYPDLASSSTPMPAASPPSSSSAPGAPTSSAPSSPPVSAASRWRPWRAKPARAPPWPSLPPGLVDGRQFLELFKRTLSYQRLSGAMRGSLAWSTDAVLVECFQATISLANHFSELNPYADFQLLEFEVNPYTVADSTPRPSRWRLRLRTGHTPRSPPDPSPRSTTSSNPSRRRSSASHPRA